MSKLIDLSIKEAKERMLKKEFSATELVKSHFEQMEKVKDLNAFVLETEQIALKQAAESDKKYASGDAGIIEGIPIGVKDLFCTKDVRTTACSKMLHNFVPNYESAVTEQLFKEGGVMVGKVNMDEFAMGSTNETSYFGPTISPWKANNSDKKITPGGSSGGSAVAVATKSCMGALGSDTGGSVRQPASFCGLVGIKPTYGRCSRYGMIAFASSLDQAGVFTRGVEDAAMLLESISGYDKRDATSKNTPVPKWSQSITNGVKGLKIGIPKEYLVEGMPEETIKMWENGKKWLQDAGAQIVDISLPNSKHALSTYYIIAPGEASSNLARFDGVRYGHRVEDSELDTLGMIAATRADGFGKEVKRRIMMGTYLLSSGQYNEFYLKAQKVRRLIWRDFIDAFQNVDAILTPTMPSEAFAFGESENDPINMYLTDILTITLNLAGLPGISVPAGLGKNGLPLGLQVMGKHFDEETIFKTALQIEQRANFKGL